jgi:hypothetical protein
MTISSIHPFKQIPDGNSKPVFLNVYGAPESIPRNEFRQLCSLAGRYDNTLPPWFLAPIDSLKIPAQVRYTFFFKDPYRTKFGTFTDFHFCHPHEFNRLFFITECLYTAHILVNYKGSYFCAPFRMCYYKLLDLINNTSFQIKITF